MDWKTIKNVNWFVRESSRNPLDRPYSLVGCLR